MGSKNIHTDAFDKGTITKLEIFEDYAEAWIPTFNQLAWAEEIHIFDFFSGPGYDSKGTPGSPIRLLDVIKKFEGAILSKKTKVFLHLNEYEPNKKREQRKYELLQKNCNEIIEQNEKFKYFLKPKYYNKDAAVLFHELMPTINKYPSLIYLDQNGVKFISQEYIDKLESLSTTDFLYFVSSSFFRRYGTTEEFRNALEIDEEELKSEEYKNMHRLVLNAMKKRLHEYSELKLFPFSIKKNKNIYGIVFGAKNFAAVDKFLKIAWKRNHTNGEADFDIDGDAGKGVLTLFGEKRLTKIEKFKKDLETFVLSKEILNNKDILIYTYLQGHIHTHAVDVVKDLKKRKKISYEGSSPKLTYENVFRKENIVTYTIIED